MVMIDDPACIVKVDTKIISVAHVDMLRLVTYCIVDVGVVVGGVGGFGVALIGSYR